MKPYDPEKISITINGVEMPGKDLKVTHAKLTIKKNIAVIYSCKNSPGKHDATGAFIPEARAFQIVHGIPDDHMIAVDCTQSVPDRRKQWEGPLAQLTQSGEALDALAIFCHGWPAGIQIGLNRKTVFDFVKSLEDKARCDFKIVLYSCLTAENDVRDRVIKDIGPAVKGGFADKLSLLLHSEGYTGTVDAHKTAGHTTVNPYVVRFRQKDNGVSWLVEPGSEYWERWIKALKGTNLRFEYPFLSELDIKLYLENVIK